MFWLPLIAAAATVGSAAIGAVSANNQAKKAQQTADKQAAAAQANAKLDKVQTTEVDLKKLVKDSQAAGFNPVTVLQAGGLSGFSTTTAKGQDIQVVPDYIPKPSIGAGILSGIASGLGTYQSMSQSAASFASQQKLAGSQNSLLQAQIQKINAPVQATLPRITSFRGGGSSSFTNNTPVKTGVTLMKENTVYGPEYQNDPAGTIVPNYQETLLPDQKRSTITDDGFDWWKQAGWPDGEIVEQIYTEVGSYPYSALKFAADLATTISYHGGKALGFDVKEVERGIAITNETLKASQRSGGSGW